MGFSPLVGTDDAVLRQFQCHEERLLLPLRTVLAQRIAVDAQHQVVAVDARGGELVRQIALPRTLQQLREGASASSER